MKKFLVFLVCLISVAGAFAAGENVPTSQSFVDSAIAQKQNKIPANDGTAQVLTNTGTPGSIGTKNIYDSSASYAGQSDALITAADFNAAVQNAINAEFVCIDWDAHGECLLMDIRSAPAQSTLPTGYTQLEYIQVSGTQWINTGISPQSDNIVYKASWRELTLEANATLFGIANYKHAPDDIWPGTLYHPWRGRTYLAIGSSSSNGRCPQDNIHVNQVNIVEIIINNGNLTKIQNGDTCTTTYDGTVQVNKNIALFRNPGREERYGVTEQCKYTQLFYWKMYDNGILVRNMIPARRDSDGVLGMYDLVSNTFFTNSGTGEFIAGPAIYLPSGN